MEKNIFIGFRLSDKEMLCIRGGYVDSFDCFHDKPKGPKHPSEPIILPPSPPIKI